MNYYEYEDYLYHYGVKGMKWGVRKKYYNSDGSLNKAGQARQEYKSAKKDYKSARKELRKASWTAVGMKGIERFDKAQAKANDADFKRIDAKVKLKTATAKNAEKARKAEFNTYKKEMSKSGLAGSASDAAYGGRSTHIYNELKQKKGKAYADRVSKRIQNEAIATIAGSVAVAVGTNVAIAMMNR